MDIFMRIYAMDYWVLFLIVLVGIAVFVLINKLMKNQKWFSNLCGAGLIAFAMFILWFTVLRRIGTPNDSYNICLIPFRSYYVGLTENEEGFRTCFMNAVLFAPIGCLLFGYNKDGNRAKPICLLLLALLLSLFIEVMQFAFKLGYAEVDDLIHNILGTIFAYGMCALLSKLNVKKD